MKIILANPRGFCAGVSRAIEIVDKILEKELKPVYVRHEVVHNKAIVDSFKKKGAIFIKELEEIPDSSVCIFSAHGVSQKVRSNAKHKKLRVFDATCPLVTKVHREVKKASNNGIECIFIGHKGHPEVEGTLGQYTNKYAGIYLVESISDIDRLKIKDPNRLSYATQTTLSIEETTSIIKALKQKYPHINAPKKQDICYATQNRQDAVRKLVKKVDIFLIVGSNNSSNSNRLYELAKFFNIDAYLIDHSNNIDLSWFKNKKICAITAGASAPEYIVQEVIKFLKENFKNSTVEDFKGTKEEIQFPLPKLLKQLRPTGIF